MILTHREGVWHINYNFSRDLALGRGQGVQEFLKARGNICFRFEDHYERLLASCEGLGNIPLDKLPAKEEIEARTKSILAKNSFTESLVRILATPGDSSDTKTPLGSPTLTVGIRQFSRSEAKIFKLKTINAQREFPQYKLTAGYGFVGIYERLAQSQGFDKFLYWSAKLGVLEGAYENIFFVTRDGQLLAPNTGMLYGITRKVVLEIAESSNLFKGVIKRPVHLYQLDYCDECFITSTTLDIAEVSLVNGHPFLTHESPTQNPYTQELKKMFSEYCDQYYREQGA